MTIIAPSELIIDAMFLFFKDLLHISIIKKMIIDVYINICIYVSVWIYMCMFS